jgi:hypothetical protein
MSFDVPLFAGSEEAPVCGPPGEGATGTSTGADGALSKSLAAGTGDLLPCCAS